MYIRFYSLFLPTLLLFFFFFNDTATTEIYTFPYTTLFRSPLRDARPLVDTLVRPRLECDTLDHFSEDRKSTRLNSSHTVISYAVFCLKKKKKKTRCN